MVLTFSRWLRVNLALFSGLIAAICVFSLFGNPTLSLSEVFGDSPSLMRDVFFHARLPRVLLAAFVGAGLSVSGVAFQSLLRNPLADPYILGVSGGAALGGVIALSFGFAFHGVSLAAFIAALGSLFLIYSIAQVDGRLPAHTLLLTGVIFNSFAFSLILLVHSLANMGQLHQIFFLLMGSLEAQELSVVLWVGVFVLIGILVLGMNATKMNLISLGEEAASQLGLDIRRYRTLIFFAASLMVGATVAIAGLIGFVGLFVPHLMRLLLGADHRLLVPASAMGGAIFLIASDFLARTLFMHASLQTQLPVGVITALVGGPFFVYLMKRRA